MIVNHRKFNQSMNQLLCKQPICKSYEVVKDAGKDFPTFEKLKFFSFIAHRFMLSITIYQS